MLELLRLVDMLVSAKRHVTNSETRIVKERERYIERERYMEGGKEGERRTEEERGGREEGR